jgi:hypothetical protein
MFKQYRATVFLKFAIDDKKMKESGLDIEMPPAGFLYDDLIQLLNGEDGVTVVESAVVKECAPLPNAIEYEVKQTLCEGCGILKETSQTQDGRLCSLCNGSVVPIRRREPFGPTIQN